MKLKIALFASARELMGASQLDLELAEPATVADLKDALATRFPDGIDLIQRSAVSVDQEFATDSTSLNSSCEIALIPPVSGG